MSSFKIPDPIMKEIFVIAGKLSLLTDPDILCQAFHEYAINCTSSLMCDPTEAEQALLDSIKGAISADNNEQLRVQLSVKRKKYFQNNDDTLYRRVMKSYANSDSPDRIYAAIEEFKHKQDIIQSVIDAQKKPNQTESSTGSGTTPASANSQSFPKLLPPAQQGTARTMNEDAMCSNDLCNVFCERTIQTRKGLKDLAAIVTKWYNTETNTVPNQYTIIGKTADALELIALAAKELSLPTLTINMSDYANTNAIDALIGTEKAYSHAACGNLARFSKENTRGIIVFISPEFSPVDTQQALMPLFERNTFFDKYYNVNFDYSKYLIFIATEVGLQTLTPEEELDELTLSRLLCDPKQTSETGLAVSLGRFIEKTRKILLTDKKPDELLNYHKACIKKQLYAKVPEIINAVMPDEVVKAWLYKYCYYQDAKVCSNAISIDINNQAESVWETHEVAYGASVKFGIDYSHCDEEVLKMLQEEGEDFNKKLMQLSWRRKALDFDCYVTVEAKSYTMTLTNFRIVQSDTACIDSLGEAYVPEGLSYDDVIGQEEAKAALCSIAPDKPFTCLFYGPPGTGKTMLAQVFACQCGYPIFALSGSELMSHTHGTAEAKLRELMNKARSFTKYTPVVIFIDECDAVFGQRREANGTNTGVLCEMLTQLSGFSRGSEPIILLMASNFKEHIDDALLSRCNRCIQFTLPSADNVHDYLKKYCTKENGWDVSEKDLQLAVTEATGIDFRKLSNALRSVGNSDSLRTRNSLLDLILTVRYGPVGVTSDIEQLHRAYHEASHAIVADALGIGLEKISIQQRGETGGSIVTESDELNTITSKNATDKCTIALAGRIGEREKFGLAGNSSSAKTDLEMIDRITDTILLLGLTEDGIPFMGNDDERYRAKRVIYQECWNTAERIVKTHWSEIERLVQVLIKQEVLYKDNIAIVLNEIRQNTNR